MRQMPLCVRSAAAHRRSIDRSAAIQQAGTWMYMTWRLACDGALVYSAIADRSAAATIGAIRWRSLAAVRRAMAALCEVYGSDAVWDARLTSVLILFFLYLGHMALLRAFDDPTRGARAAAILALAGFVNVPSSSSRSTGGTPCTSPPASCAWAAPRSIPPCCCRSC